MCTTVLFLLLELIDSLLSMLKSVDSACCAHNDGTGPDVAVYLKGSNLMMVAHLL